MFTFCISIALLVLGYLVYAKVVEGQLRVDTTHPTPAVVMQDGVDYVPMKPWRIYLIQFLNIAGVGPIIGAIMGAKFGTASFVWIVFGSIFAGAVHDFISGFISLHYKGISLPNIHGHYLGRKVKGVMGVFTILIMLLIGAVFINTPATLIENNFTPGWNIYVWIAIIFAYYLVATLLPIDKLIGKIYPVFGFLLLGMAVALVVAFVMYRPALPEVWEGMGNAHPDAEHNPIFPMMFVSIACGAISGFHATQSPLMARCITNERQARPIFYGAMITEGVVALIWAAAAAYFFGPESPVDVSQSSGAAIVGIIANQWFSPFVATICILGVISAAVTSGDTALRSCRLMVADLFGINQKPIGKRLAVAVPIFVVVLAILVYSLSDPKGFDVIWRYFAWANQVLATVTLWSVTVYLFFKRRHFVISLIPAMFMTMVTASFIFVAEKEGLGSILPRPVGYACGGVVTLAATVYFNIWAKKRWDTVTSGVRHYPYNNPDENSVFRALARMQGQKVKKSGVKK